MISKLILGTVQMGLNYGVNNKSGKISFTDSCAILSKAFESGIVLLDTAEVYGNAHKVIGDFHKLNPKFIFKVITKIPQSTDYNNVAQLIKKYCNELHVDSLEVLMFHSFDSYKNCKGDLSILELLKEKAVINHIGVSVYTNEQIEELLIDDRITVVQLPYNLLDNKTVRGDLLHQLKGKGKIVHTRSAFLQGMFFKNSLEKNRIYEELSNDIEFVNYIAKEENTTITNLALSYCLSQSDVDNVLVGVDSVMQLEENLKAIHYVISKEAIAKINSIKVKNTDLLNPSLW